MAIKAGLAPVPVPYERLRSTLTGYRGEMESQTYAQNIFANLMTDFHQFGDGMPGGTLVELGPGGSLFSGVQGRKNGFEQCILVDVGDFAAQNPALYRDMINELESGDRERFEDAVAASGNVIEAFRKIGIRYLTNGLASLREIPTRSVSFSFSNAVLEHIGVDEFGDTVVELHRIHRPGTISCHQIDYKDHLAGSLNNLRFSRNIWESRVFPNGGFYTNRLRHCDVTRAFLDAGYEMVMEKTESWHRVPLPRRNMAAEFQRYAENELLISGAYVVFRRNTN